MSQVRIVAFGEAADGIWGVAWVPGPEASGRLALHLGDQAAILEGRLEVEADGADWSFQGDAVSLVIAPTGPEGRGGGEGGALESRDRPCTVGGELRTGGSPAALACPGWRSAVTAEAELAGVASVRWLAAWLGPHDGLSLIALRPRRARGHDADVIVASVVGDPSPPRVEEPRLSTTYGEDGAPGRVGLELWFEGPDEEAPHDPPSHRYPRRAAGQAGGRPLAWEASGFGLQACFMTWRSGRSGPGVYLLAQPR